MPIAAGNIIYASDLLMTTATNADGTSRTTTSTSYTSTLSPANICGTTFVAPPSGKVMISFAAACANGTPPNLAACSPAVRAGNVLGSGAPALAADDSRAVYAKSSSDVRQGADTEVTGLTPGDIYNVVLEHRAFSAGTATFQYREVTVIPQLA